MPPDLAHALRQHLAATFGDPDALWARTRLPLFDPDAREGPPGTPAADPHAAFVAAHGRRRADGAYFTPDAVADFIVARLPSGPTWDPAVGGGVFLRAALRRGTPITQLYGQDLDPTSVHFAQALLAHALGWAHTDRIQAQVTVGDSLRTDPPRDVAVAVTNPPFLTRLKQLTAIDPAFGRQFAGRAGPYADVSVLFALRMLEAAEHVGVVLPASIVALRDAAGLRAALDARGVAWVWSLPKGTFTGVGLPTVALGTGPGPVQRLRGLPAETLGTVPPEAPWPTRLALDLPPLRLHTRGVLGDIANTSADFRDEYYALRGHIQDGIGDIALLTSGGIGVGTHAYGVRPARIHGAAWLRPMVPNTALHPRQRPQLAPKLLVATQTRVIEAVADHDARFVGTTPVVQVYPRDVPLERLLVLLLSPVASAWALNHYAGAGLNPDVIKLSASQLAVLPLPEGDLEPAMRLYHAGGTWREVGAAVTAAYGADPSLVDWWAARAGAAAEARARIG